MTTPRIWHLGGNEESGGWLYLMERTTTNKELPCCCCDDLNVYCKDANNRNSASQQWQRNRHLQWLATKILHGNNKRSLLFFVMGLFVRFCLLAFDLPRVVVLFFAFRFGSVVVSFFLEFGFRDFSNPKIRLTRDVTRQAHIWFRWIVRQG